MFHIVLLEPEIPGNTGNIGRTCAAAGSALHLIHPLGFAISENTLKRAGMDYWARLQVSEYASYRDFLSRNPEARIWYATTKGRKTYAEADFKDGDFIMFGKESAGIPEEILVEHPESCIRIPMLPEERSLNLANSAAIVLYEALRQQNFPGLAVEGKLHRKSWKDPSFHGNGFLL
ncbi:MAG: tRNA (cytidine(34)-2'-O)-methyltransferase [Lachnospiraceae bacterium]|nr:tRNA (cytidine(34)-2'-O)-methyltransferase [Lachnospiraceae bacterium]